MENTIVGGLAWPLRSSGESVWLRECKLYSGLKGIVKTRLKATTLKSPFSCHVWSGESRVIVFRPLKTQLN